jgi:excinuclease UvrABC helicase subunit UvrB
MERRDVVIVATVSAIYGIGEPESYHRMIMTLRAGDTLNQRDAIAQLIRMQYQRNDQDFSRGTFRVRGDTIDVFPAEHSSWPCASSCSTTRSRACSCSIRSRAGCARTFRASPSIPAATM